MHDSLLAVLNSWHWHSPVVNPDHAETIPSKARQAARDYLVIQRVLARTVISALRPPPLPDDLDP